MSDKLLGRDNLHLSRANMAPQIATIGSVGHDCAINCRTVIPEDVAMYVVDSLAANTQRAYHSDLAHFESWGGSIPSGPPLVASYLAANADTLSVATLVRRIASISKAHEARGLPNPARS